MTSTTTAKPLLFKASNTSSDVCQTVETPLTCATIPTHTQQSWQWPSRGTGISQGDSVCICMEQRPFDPHLQGAYSGVSTPVQTFGSLLSASELEETTWPEETTGLMALCLQEGRAQVQHCRRMKTTMGEGEALG